MENNAILITVFTPTFNRANKLNILFNSLQNQSNLNFEWLLVDDGSTDDTKKLIEELSSHSKFKISYHFKENGGKHTAINLGVEKAKGSLFFIVDSDDFLANNAVELMYFNWNKILNKHNICGIVGLSEFTNRKIIGDSFLEDNWEIPFVDIYLKYRLTGDKTVAFKTELLKEYPFPEKNGIKLVFEAVVWHEMSKKYDVLCINETIQYVEYLEDGLTNSFYKKWYLQSMAFSFFKLIENNTYPFLKYPSNYINNFVYLISNSLLVNENYFWQLKSFKNKLLYIAFFPRAYYAYFKMKNKVIN